MITGGNPDRASNTSVEWRSPFACRSAGSLAFIVCDASERYQRVRTLDLDFASIVARYAMMDDCFSLAMRPIFSRAFASPENRSARRSDPTVPTECPQERRLTC